MTVSTCGPDSVFPPSTLCPLSDCTPVRSFYPVHKRVSWLDWKHAWIYVGLVNESEDGDVNSTATPADKHANESKTHLVMIQQSMWCITAFLNGMQITYSTPESTHQDFLVDPLFDWTAKKEFYLVYEIWKKASGVGGWGWGDGLGKVHKAGFGLRTPEAHLRHMSSHANHKAISTDLLYKNKEIATFTITTQKQLQNTPTNDPTLLKHYSVAQNFL